jgi:N-acetylglucosamine-6-phosphate deacetylase
MNEEIVMAGRVLTPAGILESAIIQISGGIIQSIGERAGYRGTIDIDAGDHLIAPGFIDIHVHGAAGHSFMDSGSDGIIEALHYHRRHGTTGLLATTTTSSDEHIRSSLAALSQVIRLQEKRHIDADLGAAILGIHIEGPYLNKKRVGAQNPEWLRNPNLEEYKGWESLAPIRMVTIAPELQGAEPIIKHIRRRGNVLISAGHTDATFMEMETSMAWGVSHCTHFGNGMRGMHHREPGVFGSGLLQNGLTVEIIADGIHLHPKILELVYRVKGADHVVLVTDAVSYCGLPDGIYSHNSQDKRQIIVENNTVRLMDDGGLAGSCLTMNRAAKRMAALGVSLTEVWQMASAVPGRLIGLGDRKGQIMPGMDADLIVIDSSFQVHLTMIRGIPDNGHRLQDM